MEDSPFQTRIFVEDAYYDSQEETMLLFVRILLTGDKRVLCSHKTDWHQKSGIPGDFPNQEMNKLTQAIKGKTIIWKFYANPQIQQQSEETMERIVKRVGMQMEEIQDVLLSGDRQFEQKRQDLEREEKINEQRKEKTQAQAEALKRLREKFRSQYSS